MTSPFCRGDRGSEERVRGEKGNVREREREREGRMIGILYMYG